MIQLRFVILGIAALALVPLSAVAQSRSGDAARIDAWNRENARANEAEREMHKWHNLDIEAEEKIQQLQKQLNYERDKDNYGGNTDQARENQFIRERHKKRHKVESNDD
jgi:hypothetical protein